MIELLMLTWKRMPSMQRCLLSLSKTLARPDVSLSILDNGSPQSQAEWLLKYARERERVRLTLSTDNRGVAGGRDTLLREASGDTLVFLDSDVVATADDWLEKLVQPLDRADVGIAGCAGHWITVDRRGKWKWFEASPDAGECDVVSGYCQAFRQSAVADFRMDLKFNPYWMEDSDMCLWLADRGYKVWNTGEIGLQHIYAGSGDDGRGAEKLQYLAHKWQGQNLIRAEKSVLEAEE